MKTKTALIVAAAAAALITVGPSGLSGSPRTDQFMDEHATKVCAPGDQIERTGLGSARGKQLVAEGQVIGFAPGDQIDRTVMDHPRQREAANLDLQAPVYYDEYDWETEEFVPTEESEVIYESDDPIEPETESLEDEYYDDLEEDLEEEMDEDESELDLYDDSETELDDPLD